MQQEFDLEKFEWNQEDFGAMGWHDVTVYAMAFNENIMFDIDYIFE